VSDCGQGCQQEGKKKRAPRRSYVERALMSHESMICHATLRRPSQSIHELMTSVSFLVRARAQFGLGAGLTGTQKKTSRTVSDYYCPACRSKLVLSSWVVFFFCSRPPSTQATVPGYWLRKEGSPIYEIIKRWVVYERPPRGGQPSISRQISTPKSMVR
jgi:hypothetical protein